MTNLLAHIPVLSQAQLGLFVRLNGRVDRLLLIGSSLLQQFQPKWQEIRAIAPSEMADILRRLNYFPVVEVIETTYAPDLAGQELVAARDALTVAVLNHFYPQHLVTWETAFLRWHTDNVKSSLPAVFDRESHDTFDQDVVRQAIQVAALSSDWWRHVGCVVVKGGENILKGYNHHLPSDYTPYIDGSPRDFVPPGQDRMIDSSIHAEKSVIAVAARYGIALEGSSFYVSVFPCPVCARDMITAGVHRCFFPSGNAWLGTDEAFRTAGVEMIYVPLKNP